MPRVIGCPKCGGLEGDFHRESCPEFKGLPNMPRPEPTLRDELSEKIRDAFQRLPYPAGYVLATAASTVGPAEFARLLAIAALHPQELESMGEFIMEWQASGKK